MALPYFTGFPFHYNRNQVLNQAIFSCDTAVKKEGPLILQRAMGIYI